MEQTVLREELKLFCPDGFHFMDAEERARLHLTSEDTGVCLSDPERHMLVSVAWTRFQGVTTQLRSNLMLARQTERDVRKSMQALAYRPEGFFQRSVGGRSAEGFGYAYAAQDVAMYGEICVLKTHGALYYFHLYAREALKAESLPVWKDLLSDAEWL